jgi:hypothetical protein
MAKAKLSPLLVELRGTLGRGMVLRRSPRGIVVSRSPDMSKVKWSPAQKAQRELMEQARLYYRQEMAKPAKATRYRTLARKAGIPVSAYVMGGFMRRNRPAKNSERSGKA